MEEQETDNANLTTTIENVGDSSKEDSGISEADRQVIATVKQNFAELYGNIKDVCHSSRKFCDVFQYIKSTYFYESLANFNVQTRLNNFYKSLKVGDKFVAKVSNVFERSADVVLVWSSRRDISELKIKAYLKLIDSKRYNRSNSNHSSSSRYSRHSQQTTNDVTNDRNLDISELVYVQVVSFNETTKKVEVIRCKDLGENEFIADDDTNENEILEEEKYKSKSSDDISFRDYMKQHCDLRNPALIKQQPFTSLLHQTQVVDCLKRKLLLKSSNASSTRTNDNREIDVITIDSDSRQNSNEPSHNDKQKGSHRSSTGDEILSNKSTLQTKSGQGNSQTNHSAINNDNRNERKPKSSLSRSPSRIRKHSSSSSDSDSSTSSSSSSSDDSRRKRKKHHHNKSKSHRHDKRKHKKKSSKKKSKKNKDKRKRKDSKSERNHHDQHHHSNRKKRKINDKILKLLNLA